MKAFMWVNFARNDGLPDNNVMSIFRELRVAGFEMGTPLLYKADRRLYMRYAYKGKLSIAEALAALAGVLGQENRTLDGSEFEAFPMDVAA